MKFLVFTIPGTDGSPVAITPPGGIPSGGVGNGTASKILSNSIVLFLVLLGLICLFFIIWGGIKWISSDGDKGKIDGARKTITFAIIGLILALLAFAIVQFIGSIFGVQLFPFHG